MSDCDLIEGDCRAALARIAAESVDSIVTDPPYGLNFMGKKWDTGEVAFDPEFWRLALAALKPGGHLVAFSGTRTYHRMVTAIEDAGFGIRDQLAWVYGTGFPKSHNVSKAIDKHLGAERTKVRRPAAEVGNFKGRADSRPFIEAAKQRGYHEAASDEAASDEAAGWQGWGTALKPAWEPIVMARKAFKGTVAGNVLAHGTGGLNIDGCRIGTSKAVSASAAKDRIGQLAKGAERGRTMNTDGFDPNCGRWPANIVHDGSDEVLAAFPVRPGGKSNPRHNGEDRPHTTFGHDDDEGSAARFFYSAKASRADRNGSRHPTVKPVALMRWLVRLVTPAGGLVLDPFAGSGTTGAAAIAEGRRIVMIEREAEYAADIRRRMAGDDIAPPPQGRKIYGQFADQQPLWK